MILSKYVSIKISNNQIKYYREKGLNVKGGNEIISIPIELLPDNSGCKIIVKCDFCGLEKSISKHRYMMNTIGNKLYACSRKCGESKNIQTINKKYGVNNISKLEGIKRKKEKTCFDHFQVKYPQQSEEIFNKSKKSKLEKYNYEFYNNPEKRMKTNILKYGCEYPNQNELVKEKIKKTYYDSIRKEIIENYSKYNIIDYDINDKYILKCDCDKDHTFSIFYKLLYQRKNSNTILCTICNPIDKHTSGLEIQLLDFIKENYSKEIIENDRNLIGKELDIYLPELKLAFEFNGVYWHSNLYKENNYHQMKSDLCEEKGIQLIHVWEDDWIYKQEIIKSMILNKLGKTSNKIYARKCEIKEINDNQLVKDFLNKNHIQGFVGSSAKIGLFYNNQLVSLMTFGKKRKFMNSSSKEGEYELLRFCNQLNTNVIGGASRLFSYFIKYYSFTEITTYADRSYSNGNLYNTLGFKFIGKTEPNYYYIIDGIRKHRFGFRKDVLVKEGFYPNKTEHEIMMERGINRIYNAGNLKYQKI